MRAAAISLATAILLAGGAALADGAVGGDPAGRPLFITLMNGKQEKRVDLSKLPSVNLVIHDPTDGGKKKTLVGPRLAGVLALVERKPGAQMIAVRCDDGWLSLLYLDDLATFSDAILATEQILDDGKRIPLPAPRGPIFLAVSDRERTVKYKRPYRAFALADNGYAFQVASIELTRYETLMGNTLTLPGNPPNVAEGQQRFYDNCLHCHALNGAGGTAGMELNNPSVLVFRGEERVRKYILNPRALNPDGHMPAFKWSKSQLDALVAYLKYMAKLPLH